MRLKRRLLPAVSDDPRFDGDAASSVCDVACGREARSASATKGAAARVMARSTFEPAGAFCGSQCLSDEGLAAASVANPSKADAQVIVASHGVLGREVRFALMLFEIFQNPGCRAIAHIAASH